MAPNARGFLLRSHLPTIRNPASANFRPILLPDNKATMQTRALPDSPESRSTADSRRQRENNEKQIFITGKFLRDLHRVQHAHNSSHRAAVIGANRLDIRRWSLPHKHFISLSMGEGTTAETKTTRKAPGRNPQWNETVSL